MPVKPKEPFVPIFVGDFLAATAEWTGEQRALYMLLLCYQWAGGSLTADLPRLASVVGYDRAGFMELWRVVGPKFEEHDGRLTNARLEVHRARSRELSAVRSQVGRLGAKAKWRLPSDVMPEPSRPNGKGTKRDGKPDAVAKQKDAIRSDPIRSDQTSSQDLKSSPSHTGARTSKNGRSDPERERERPAEVAKRRHDPKASEALARVGMRPKATP